MILHDISGVKADIKIVPGAPSAAVPFDPKTFTMAVGGTVTWINLDTTTRTVTSNTTGTFDSALLGTGATWSHTFAQAGTYHYHCSPYPRCWESSWWGKGSDLHRGCFSTHRVHHLPPERGIS